MRPASSVVVLALLLPSCAGPDAWIQPVAVSWMEWPAEVVAGEPFAVRLAGRSSSCWPPRQVVVRPAADASALTLEPYSVFDERPVCPVFNAPETIQPPNTVSTFDTLVTMRGLAAVSVRLYEMRAGTSEFAWGIVRTFGEITVRPFGSVIDRVEAGGFARTFEEAPGCVRLVSPSGVPRYLLDGPAQPITSFELVRGYVYDAATPVCGETRVFHLLSVH